MGGTHMFWGISVFAALVTVAACVALLRAHKLAASLRAAEHERAQRAADGELLRVLFDHSPFALVLCTDAGRIVFDNAAARRLFFEERSAQGQNFLRLVANGPSALQSALLQASDEIVGLSVEGQHELFHVSRRKLQHGGEPHTLIMVRPMTREVAQHDIAVLKRVVRLLSHEVNNSLAPVSSLLHSARVIVASGERIERLQRVFDTIDERSQHLAAFIASYAALARLPQPAPRAVEWGALLGKLSALYPEAQLGAPPGATGYFDPGQLEQALINLLKNAYEAGGPADGIQVRVTPLQQQAAELSVSDRGRGFSREALEHALLPFYTTKPGGSGVGLALVREVVHAHGGSLSLGENSGGGAAIRMWLPGPSASPSSEDRARLTLTRA
jgi:two-component system, NtrC family, nitrogen regulation sensor histidine kinase NtrY